MNARNARNAGNPKTLWEGKYLKVVDDKGWQYVERQGITGIVCMLPLTDDGKVVLIEQYRPPVKASVIELPAGLVGDEPGKEDESLESAAHRELLEETGYEAKELEELFDGVVSAGLSDERLTYFLAKGCRKVGPGGGDGSEDIKVHEVLLSNAMDWIKTERAQGKTVDVKALAILSFWLRESPIDS